MQEIREGAEVDLGMGPGAAPVEPDFADVWRQQSSPIASLFPQKTNNLGQGVARWKVNRPSATTRNPSAGAPWSNT